MGYQWWIVVSVFVTQVFLVGLATYSFPLILVAVRESFGATSTQINLALTASATLGIFLPPLIGPLIDRWSVRGLMTLGTLSFICGLGLLSFTEGITQFIWVYAFFITTANTLLGPMTGPALIARWFTSARGRALGIAATGASLGGFAFPWLVAEWLSAAGWRWTLQISAVLVSVCVLPFVFFVLRDYPPLSPEAPSQAEPGSATQANPAMMTNRDILRAPAYWIIGICFGLLFMTYTAVLSNLGMFLEGLGFEASLTGTLISVVAISGLVGKLALGAASDRIGLKAGLAIALCLTGSGIFLFSTEPPYSILFVGACVLGLSAGGMVPVWTGMVAAGFGTPNFGRAMGLMSPMIAVLVMPGYLIAGWSDDTMGSFRPAFQFFVASIGLAFLLLPFLKLGPSARLDGEVSSPP